MVLFYIGALREIHKREVSDLRPTSSISMLLFRSGHGSMKY